VRFRTPAISLCFCLFALFVYCVWKWSYFGGLIPNTFYLKATGKPLLQWTYGVKYSLLFLVYEANLMALLLLVPLVRLRDHLHLAPHLLILIGYGFFNFLCGGDWMPLFRFYVPVIPSMVLLIGSAFGSVAEGSRRQAGRLSLAFCLALVLKAGVTVTARVDGDNTIRDVMAQVHARAHVRCFEELGTWMRDNLPVTTTLASSEAGVVPYLTGFYYIDMKGYIDRHIAHLDCPIPIWCKYDNDYILSRRPDCIMVNEIRKGTGQGKASLIGNRTF